MFRSNWLESLLKPSIFALERRPMKLNTTSQSALYPVWTIIFFMMVLQARAQVGQLMNYSTNLFVPSGSIPNFNYLPQSSDETLLLSLDATNYGTIYITNIIAEVMQSPINGDTNQVLFEPADEAGLFFSPPVAAVQFVGSVIGSSAIYAFNTNGQIIGIYPPQYNATQTFTLADGTGTNLISILRFDTANGSGVYLENLAVELSLGNLQVSIHPARAVAAGAEFQIDGGAWQTNGAIVSGLAAGVHTVSFNSVPDWFTPTNEIVQVVLGVSNTATATYSAEFGAVQVNIAPPNVVAAGAQWQMDNGPLENSGAQLTDVSPGNHTIFFSAEPGWFTPTNETIDVVAGSTNNVTTIYAPDVGTVQVNIQPLSAIQTGAEWQLDNGPWENSGVLLTNVDGGTHTISYNALPGWFTPNTQSVEVMSDMTNIETGLYTPNIGAVQVNIEPSCAVEAGAQWQLDNGPWETNGALLTNVDGGTHTISFNTVIGWSPPSSEIITVTADTTNSVLGEYSEAPTPGKSHGLPCPVAIITGALPRIGIWGVFLFLGTL